MTRFLTPLLAASFIFLVACSTAPPLLNPDSLVTVKEVNIPKDEPWFAQFATHTYIDYRPDKDSGWRRIEIVNSTSGILHHRISLEEFNKAERWEEEVRLIGQSDASSNPDFARDISDFAQNYDASAYRAWPGPNSNSFAERMLRKVPGISGTLDHNAIGKEHGFYAGKSASGDSIELQTPAIGMAVGPHDGIELSLFGFSGGVAFSPLGIKIPFVSRIPKR